MIRYLSFFLLAIILVGGIAYKLDWFASKKTAETSKETAKNDKKSPSISTVKAYIIKHEDLENKITVIGTLIPNEEVILTTETTGKVKQILFDEGMVVQKGQLLLKLNDTELQAQLQRLLIQQEVLEQRRKRDEQLVQKQGISEQDWEILQGDIKAKQTEVEVVKAQLAKTQITAPFSGTLGLRNISEGTFMTTATPIATLTDSKSMKIDFAVPEKYAHQISQGTKIEFSVNGNPTTFKAVVKAVETKIEATTRTLKIRASCDNSTNELRAGAFTTVTILLDVIKNTMLIPSQALLPELEAKKVYQIKNGIATLVTIEVGMRTEQQIQVLSGLALGDTIIYSGILQVKPNSQVKIIEIK